MLLILYDVVWWTGINKECCCCCCCYCCSVAKSCWLFETPCTAARQASLSLIISWSWPRFMFIALVMPSSHLILWCPLLLCPWSFPESGTFPMSCLFASGDQNTGVSASGSVLPVNIQGWSPLRLPGLISLLSKGLSEVFSSTTIWRHQCFDILPSLWYSSHNRTWSLGRPQPWLCGPLLAEECLLFNTLKRLSSFSCQKAIIFWFHNCSHCLQWFWSPRRRNLPLLPHIPLLFAMQ